MACAVVCTRHISCWGSLINVAKRPLLNHIIQDDNQENHSVYMGLYYIKRWNQNILLKQSSSL